MEGILTFDCYGTLLNTAPIYEAVEAIAKKHGLDGKAVGGVFSSYEDRLMYGEDYIPYDALILRALEYCDFEMATDIFRSGYDQILSVHENIIPLPDVMETLRALHERGYELALMSNSAWSIMQHNLKAFDGLFQNVILAQDVHAYKPQLAFFRYAEEMLKLKEREHWHIAKGYWWDIRPCTRMGWRKIWVNRERKKGMEKFLPYDEVHALDEVLKIIP